MIRFPNAKINLGLSIVSKRADGYHNLETVFYPVNICDVLEVLPNKTGDIVLHASGLEVTASVEDNLLVKAYRLLQQHYPIGGVDVYFRKQIPFGAGMGGGSADASFLLLLLRDLFLPEVTDDRLAELALTIGADCPFFIYNRPVYAQGKGELFTHIGFSLKDYQLVVVKPEVHVSTKDAFSKVVPTTPALSVAEVVATMPVSQWKGKLHNDFEASVFAIHPVLREIKDRLYESGALYAAMSGSGSALFGIFPQEARLRAEDYPNCFFWQGNCEY